MNAHVTGQVTALSKLFVTHRTCVIFLFHVDYLHMLLHIICMFEQFITHVTFVWFLSCMTAHVTGQVTALSKLFSLLYELSVYVSSGGLSV